ncbi:hypothetical protein BBF93_11105 [Hyphomonas sp. CACIAM 19H1]|uniref:Hpt domain-containing protein n=1 Tax=Hyphomonas sp. CACIAM 19H1 TaxID=1873716 RepID=UPI000DEE14ED|nr:Hpt domain-containing protein [Hyphomonas sp. CACIAM 19H1]AXE64712.1 hypothetical protein BBF93_11105 [Hyphomonas sp. CACIAM 19H1]
MLGKFLKKLDTAKFNRKPAQTVVAPDISRVIRPASATTPAHEEMAPAAITPPEPVFVADPQEMVTQAEEALDALTEEFEGWMRNDLEKMRDAWRIAQKPHATADDYRTLYTCAHNIRGAATSYGYPAVSRLCGSLCDLLSGTRAGENTALINLHIEACRAAVAAGPQGEGSESVADAVCEALERRVALKVGNAG